MKVGLLGKMEVEAKPEICRMSLEDLVIPESKEVILMHIHTHTQNIMEYVEYNGVCGNGVCYKCSMKKKSPMVKAETI